MFRNPFLFPGNHKNAWDFVGILRNSRETQTLEIQSSSLREPGPAPLAGGGSANSLEILGILRSSGGSLARPARHRGAAPGPAPLEARSSPRPAHRDNTARKSLAVKRKKAKTRKQRLFRGSDLP